MYWKHADFGFNPEHPPLVKLIDGLPLLPLKLPFQPLPQIHFRAAPARGGIQSPYSPDAGTVLSLAAKHSGLLAGPRIPGAGGYRSCTDGAPPQPPWAPGFPAISGWRIGTNRPSSASWTVSAGTS